MKLPTIKFFRVSGNTTPRPMVKRKQVIKGAKPSTNPKTERAMFIGTIMERVNV